MKTLIPLLAMASVVWFVVCGEVMVAADTAQDALLGLFCGLLGLLFFCAFTHMMARRVSQ